MAGSSGADFHLPDEILAVIPTDPYDQLDLARKITSMAIASRVSNLELENGHLAKRLADKDRAIADLEDRLAKSEARLRDVLDENTKLSSERDAMTSTIKKLGRDLAKLEAFKRQLVQSLHDDSSPVETVDIGIIDQSGAKSLTIEGTKLNTGHSISSKFASGLNGNTTSSYSGGSVSDAAQDSSKQTFSLTPYISPRMTPTATSNVTSTSGSPRGYSTVVSPRSVSGTTSPTKSHLENRSTLPSWYPLSTKPSAPTSPPHGHPVAGRPRIDGKEFFRQARSRLSYEQFGAFLANIKELNAHKQSREETLRKAEEIFGTDNKDLYLSFQGLLNRNIS